MKPFPDLSSKEKESIRLKSCFKLKFIFIYSTALSIVTSSNNAFMKMPLISFSSCSLYS